MANPAHVDMMLNYVDRWNQLVWERHVKFYRDQRPAEQAANRLDLRGVELTNSDLRGRRFDLVDLSGANLKGAYFGGADFTGALLTGANLARARLPGTVLLGVDLTNADLTASVLTNAKITLSILDDTLLVDANLTDAVISTPLINKGDFAGAHTSRTVWANVDLREAKNLAQIVHKGPSTVGLDTIIQSAGQIPEVFLRGCGVPDEAIAYTRTIALIARDIRLYSCFISHSSRDQEFCERLHNDLQAAGVRCWFAPEDLKIGTRFRDEIESAIGLHDKLLLVLSGNSVNSEWVQTEVESALEREQRQRVQVLFPVRLDDAVMDTPQAWAADVRRKRHIGDFTRWKDHDHYQMAFRRLLRDLRATRSS
jgi:hypothetical protein